MRKSIYIAILVLFLTGCAQSESNVDTEEAQLQGNQIILNGIVLKQPKIIVEPIYIDGIPDEDSVDEVVDDSITDDSIAHHSVWLEMIQESYPSQTKPLKIEIQQNE